MKHWLTGLVVLTSSFGSFALASLGKSEYPRVVQSQEFTGRPGYSTHAILAEPSEGDDLELTVAEESLSAREIKFIFTNKDLALPNPRWAGRGSKLEVTQYGSLKIVTFNSGGRDRFTRTLTVAYRNNHYVVAGFTYEYYDAADGSTDTCDYNLLNQSGIRKGQRVKINTGEFRLDEMKESEKTFTCNGW